MRKALTSFVLVAFALFAPWSAAQQTTPSQQGTSPTQRSQSSTTTQQPPESITEVHWHLPRADMTQQYEAGRKKHMDFHRAQNDGWTWHVWEIVSGDNVGSFLSESGGHRWKEFDAREKFNTADGADAARTLEPNIEKDTTSYYAYRPTMSTQPEGGPPPKMAIVNHFYVEPEAVWEYREAVEKIVDTIKRNPKAPRVMSFYQLVNGGEGPHFVQVIERDSYSEMDQPLARHLLEGVVGKEQAEALLYEANKHVKSTNSEMMVYRADLSYLPKERSSAAKR